MISRIIPLRTLATMVTDAVALTLAAVMAIGLRASFGVGVVPIEIYVAAWPALPLMLLILALRRLYRSLPCAAHEELRHITLSVTLGFGLLGTGAFLSGQADAWSRWVLLLAWLLALALVPLLRWLLRLTCSLRQWWRTPCIVLGGGATGRLVVQRLLRNPWIGLHPVAVLDDDPALIGSTVHGVPIVGPLSEAAAIARRMRLDTAIVAMPGAPAERLFALERENAKVFSRLVLVPALVGFASSDLSAHDLGGIVGISTRRQLLMPIPRLVKRVLDLALIVVLAIPVVLLLGVLALAIRLTSRGPVFFRQQRLGMGGSVFPVLKFRTMVVDAEQRLAEVLATDPVRRVEYETYHKMRNDPRVTAIGALLRKTSLDELPQFWNVVRGQMSFVGPRAYLVSEREKMSHHADLILGVRPGITGLWQVSGRSEITFGERLEMEQHYVRIWSVWLDIVILVQTIRVVLMVKGAY